MYIEIYNVMLIFPRDRFRTTVNVLGDSLGAGIVNQFSQNELSRLSQQKQRTATDNNQFVD